MTHIVLIENNTDFSKLGIKSSEKMVLIAEKNGVVPVSAIPYISSKSIEFVDSYDETALAFLCGKLASSDSVQIHTSMKHLADVVNGKKTVKRAKKSAPILTKEEKTAKAEKPAEKPIAKDSFAESMNPPEVEVKNDMPAEKTPRKYTKTAAPKVGSAIPKVTKEQVAKILKKGGFDEKFADAVLAGISSSMTRSTVEMMVRMELAKSVDDKELVRKITAHVDKNLG